MEHKPGRKSFRGRGSSLGKRRREAAEGTPGTNALSKGGSVFLVFITIMTVGGLDSPSGLFTQPMGIIYDKSIMTLEKCL